MTSACSAKRSLVIHVKKDRRISGIQGCTVIALPIGKYVFKVGTRTVKFEIKESKVTEF
jgi:hypothetical protein